MASSQSGVTIEEADVRKFLDRANPLLAAAKWQPKQDPFAKSKEQGAGGWRDSTTLPLAEQSISIVSFTRKLADDALLLPDGFNHVLGIVRKGLCLGMHLCQQYTRFSGLEELVRLNQRGALTGEQKTRFSEMQVTAAAVAAFSSAYYVVWSLSDYRTDETSGVNIKLDGLPELALVNPVSAFQCMVFYYAAYLERSGQVASELDFIAMTNLYFKAVIDEIQRKAESFRQAESFTGQTYRLAGSEFSINGFAADLKAGNGSVEFNRVDLDDIVGNQDAKHKALRLAERLMCYDLVAQRNPMSELGGLAFVRMGHGVPGTGKTMQISATATMLYDWCTALGIPFFFNPMPDNIVSTFQGGSAERAIAWMKPLFDPKRIIYAPADDAENNYEDRTRQGVSAGVREVIGVFLRHTEGAYAIKRGNSVIELFTNIPDQIDPAVLSRVLDRFVIGGALEWYDFVDQDYLWWRKLKAVDPTFIDMEDPKGFTYLEKQKVVASLADAYSAQTQEVTPSVKELDRIIAEVESQYPRHGHEFYGRLFAAFKKAFPGFSSRDVRNIQTLISERILDFGLPAEWLKDPEMFYRKDYATKLGMLKELMRESMRGLHFAEVRWQETYRYLVQFLRIQETGSEREIKRMAEHIRLQAEATRRVSSRS